jgi:glyoxylase-like metal-dependent hydrolase (beta-lactamase superfamily II)
MASSLARLAALEGNLRVLPGHEEDSTLEQERQTNPWLRVAAEI